MIDEAPVPGVGGRPIARRPASSHGGGLANLFIPLLGFALVAGMRFGIPAILRALFGGLSRGLARPSRTAAQTGGDDPFEARVASRLAELQGDTAPVPQANESAVITARGFGRRGI